jgi:uncharacterized protein
LKKLTLTLTALASALLLAAPGLQSTVCAQPATIDAARGFQRAATYAQGTSVANPAADAQNVIVTAGEGMVTSAPDRAFVSISAESRAKLPKMAQQQNAQAMTAVQARLKAAGISGEAVRTTTLDLQPEFDYNDGKQTLRGYVARNTIEVRVDAIDKVGEVVDAAVTSGATSVSNIRFDLKDRQAAQQRALAEAVTDARARADALAKAAGVSINRIVRIEDQSESYVPPPRPMPQFRMAAAEAASTPVAPGQLEIRARIVLTVKVN